MWRKRTERVTVLNEEMERIVSGRDSASSPQRISNEEYFARHNRKLKQLPRG